MHISEIIIIFVKQMRVFIFKPNCGAYCGGCIIVGANSAIEAYGVIAAKSEFLAHNTDLKHCTESTILGCNLKEPSIIVDTLYVE